MVTFQGQLRLLSGLGTARSGHAGSCHCITALEAQEAHAQTHRLALDLCMY